MKVSVIVPVYNTETYLPACVDSVLHQSFADFEVILVDDGSTDGSPALCDRYAAANDRIRVVHQKNGGLSAARNAGLACAKGKYVFFLDSDDCIVSDALQKLYDLAEEKNAQTVFFEGFLIDEEGNKIYDRELSAYISRQTAYPDVYGGAELFAAMKKNGDYIPCVWAAFYLREAITVSFTPILHEDELFTAQQMYAAKRVCCCPEKLYAYRVRKNSITQTKVTAAHYHGRVTAILTLARLENIDDALRRHIYELSYSAAMCYARLDKGQKKIAEPERRELMTFLRQTDEPWARRSLLICRLGCLIPVYTSLRSHLPHGR